MVEAKERYSSSRSGSACSRVHNGSAAAAYAKTVQLLPAERQCCYMHKGSAAALLTQRQCSHMHDGNTAAANAKAVQPLRAKRKCSCAA